MCIYKPNRTNPCSRRDPFSPPILSPSLLFRKVNLHPLLLHDDPSSFCHLHQVVSCPLLCSRCCWCWCFCCTTPPFEVQCCISSRLNDGGVCKSQARFFLILLFPVTFSFSSFTTKEQIIVEFHPTFWIFEFFHWFLGLLSRTPFLMILLFLSFSVAWV